MLSWGPSPLLHLFQTKVTGKASKPQTMLIHLQAALDHEDDEHYQQEGHQQDLPPGDALGRPIAKVIHINFFIGRRAGTVSWKLNLIKRALLTQYMKCTEVFMPSMKGGFYGATVLPINKVQFSKTYQRTVAYPPLPP
jgi:hypothetical protein